MSLEQHPAPWMTCPEPAAPEYWDVFDANQKIVIVALPKWLSEKICQWRNAEAIMMERGWTTQKCPDGFVPVQSGDALGKVDPIPGLPIILRDNPSEAILAADAWLKEHSK